VEQIRRIASPSVACSRRGFTRGRQGIFSASCAHSQTLSTSWLDTAAWELLEWHRPGRRLKQWFSACRFPLDSAHSPTETGLSVMRAAPRNVWQAVLPDGERLRSTDGCTPAGREGVDVLIGIGETNLELFSSENVGRPVRPVAAPFALVSAMSDGPSSGLATLPRATGTQHLRQCLCRRYEALIYPEGQA